MMGPAEIKKIGHPLVPRDIHSAAPRVADRFVVPFHTFCLDDPAGRKETFDRERSKGRQNRHQKSIHPAESLDIGKLHITHHRGAGSTEKSFSFAGRYRQMRSSVSKALQVNDQS